MAFDGITIANLAYEFKSTLEGGKGLSFRILHRPLESGVQGSGFRS